MRSGENPVYTANPLDCDLLLPFNRVLLVSSYIILDGRSDHVARHSGPPPYRRKGHRHGEQARRYQEASILIAERMPSGAARAANATVLRGRASLLRPLLTESSRTETTNGSHGRGGYGAARAWMLPRRLVRGRQERARRGTAQAGGGAIGPGRSRNPFTPFSFLR